MILTVSDTSGITRSTYLTRVSRSESEPGGRFEHLRHHLVSQKLVNRLALPPRFLTFVNILGGVLSSNVEQGVLAVGNHGAPDIRDLGPDSILKNELELA